EGQVVLDPFLGSGSTAIAAIQSGRNYIGIEKEKENFDICQKRIDECEKIVKLL
ncbi:MAG: site-specific DNA-methyltransferase, partial [Alphaproteobacteria bacterium]|nr:site-specific DNA-methyltransferase [Alphaproteobacteria bacterium]